MRLQLKKKMPLRRKKNTNKKNKCQVRKNNVAGGMDEDTRKAYRGVVVTDQAVLEASSSTFGCMQRAAIVLGGESRGYETNKKNKKK